MKGLILFSNLMEDNEALGTNALLRRAKIDIKSVSMEESLYVTTSYDQVVKADINIDMVDLKEYDFLVIPGGPYVSKTIDSNEKIFDVIRYFSVNNKLICAICAAPRFLGRLGLLDNIKFCGYPGSENDAPLGAYLKDKKAVRDNNIITARSAGAVVDFSYEIIMAILGENDAKKLLENIIY